MPGIGDEGREGLREPRTPSRTGRGQVRPAEPGRFRIREAGARLVRHEGADRVVLARRRGAQDVERPGVRSVGRVDSGGPPARPPPGPAAQTDLAWPESWNLAGPRRSFIHDPPSLLRVHYEEIEHTA